MTDPSKGLLPQLVDVLHALADSQELLTDRIRGAHPELLGVHLREVGNSLPQGRSDPYVPCLIATSQVPVHGPNESLFAHTGEVAIAGPALNHTDAISNGHSQLPAITDSLADVTTQPHRLTEEAIPVAGDDIVEQATPGKPGDVENTGSEPTQVDSDNRNYNFFDELDARLAVLHGSQNGSDEP